MNKTTPIQVLGLSEIIALAGGYGHSVVLKDDGTVWAWGRNSAGQLGDGTTVQRATPVRVNDLSDITKIATGIYHTLALKADGSVWVWGYNSH